MGARFDKSLARDSLAREERPQLTVKGDWEPLWARARDGTLHGGGVSNAQPSAGAEPAAVSAPAKGAAKARPATLGAFWRSYGHDLPSGTPVKLVPRAPVVRPGPENEDPDKPSDLEELMLSTFPYGAEIRAIYQERDPQKNDRVPVLLAKYSSSLQLLYRTVCDEYSVPCKIPGERS